MSKLVITIDGPAGSGKSTIAKMVAQCLGITFLDTGAMYRAVTLAAVNNQIDLTDEDSIIRVLETSRFEFISQADLMKVIIDGCDVTEAIRDRNITASVHNIASSPKIRNRLVRMQRDFAERAGSVVAEGRDQGTVVFGDADYKFFLTADVAERARRRVTQLAENGHTADIVRIQEDIEMRDLSDKTREVGPLVCADDAIIVDTTNMDINEVVEYLLEHINNND